MYLQISDDRINLVVMAKKVSILTIEIMPLCCILLLTNVGVMEKRYFRGNFGVKSIYYHYWWYYPPI
jgi:hypothetical protein